MLPQSSPNSAVLTYCSQLQIPKKDGVAAPDHSDKLFQKRTSNANLAKAPSTTALAKQQSTATLTKQVSVKGTLAPQPR